MVVPSGVGTAALVTAGATEGALVGFGFAAVAVGGCVVAVEAATVGGAATVLVAAGAVVGGTAVGGATVGGAAVGDTAAGASGVAVAACAGVLPIVCVPPQPA